MNWFKKYGYKFPLRTYFKVWRYFKFPKPDFQSFDVRGWYLGLPIRCNTRFTKWLEKWVCWNSFDVSMKPKIDYVAYENPPQFSIIFFQKRQYIWRWIAPDHKNDYIYWETIASFLNNGKDIFEAVEDNQWSFEDEHGNRIYQNAYLLDMLTENGKKEYLRRKNSEK